MKISRTTRYLHWFIALCLLSLVSLGLYMSQTSSYFLYPWHKSLGILLFIVMLGRVIWSWIRTETFPSASNLPRWQIISAKWSHRLLLLITVLFPVSGITMNIANGFGLHIFSWTLISTNIVEGKRIALFKPLGQFAHSTHQTLLWVLAITLFIHISAALYHHWYRKDTTLTNMLGKEER